MAIDSQGNAFLVEGRQTLGDFNPIPESQYEIVAQVGDKLIPLYYFVNGGQGYGGPVRAPVVDKFYGDALGPDIAELTGRNELTIIFRTNNINTTTQGWISISKFALDSGNEIAKYNFTTKRFSPVNPSDPANWGPYYNDGNGANDNTFNPNRPTYTCIYDLNVRPSDPDYKYYIPYYQAKKDFAEVFAQTGNSFSSGPSTKTLTTTPGVDALIGTAKTKDTFSFAAAPEFDYNIDKITNFSAKDNDVLQLSKSAFGVTAGKFAIAKNPKKLAKLLASDTNFIYNQKSGELIFNANGSEPEFGTDGGVFAQLVGSPKLLGSSVTFI
jgi:hypothetical protein